MVRKIVIFFRYIKYKLIRNILSLKNSFHEYFRNWVFIFFVIFSIVWSVYTIQEWIYRYCCCPLSYVIVTGNRQFVTNEDIRDAIISLGVLGNFIKQDVNIIQKQIKQVLPWIHQISIRKKWPDTLKIHVIEYVPAAYWNSNLVISTTGVVLQVSDLRIVHRYENDNAIQMPFLYGPEDKIQEVLNNYLIFHAVLKSNKFQIKSATMDVHCSWQLHLIEEGINLRLGRDNVIERLCYFITIYPVLIYKIHEYNKCIDYIDLRYRSGFVVKWITDSIKKQFFKKSNMQCNTG